MFLRGLLASALFIATASVNAFKVDITIPDTAVTATAATAAVMGSIYAAPLITKATLLTANSIFKGLTAAQLKAAQCFGFENYAQYIRKHQRNLSNFFESDFTAEFSGYTSLALAAYIGGMLWLVRRR
jgi:hypothetical protein